MKKCPNCQKTYDDNLKFCQADGTPLVAVAEDKPEENPYKTTVAKKSDLPIPPEEKKPEPEPEPEAVEEVDPYATMVAGSDLPEPKEEDVLEIPEKPVDPMKTMVAGGDTSERIQIDMPVDEPAKQAEKEAVQPSPSSSQTDSETDKPRVSGESAAGAPNQTPPPEEPVRRETPSVPPAAAGSESRRPEPQKKEDTPATPIPSPFEESMPPGFMPPTTPPFDTPESPVEPEQADEPVEPERAASPHLPEALPSDFADVEEVAVEVEPAESSVPVPTFGQNIEASKSSPPAPAGEGASQVMAYVSLGLGVIGLICCFSIIPSVAAVIVGYIARSKAIENPAEYGGATYAMIGIVLGVIGTIIGILLLVFQILLGGLGSLLRGF